jgi:hypothetical protein
VRERERERVGEVIMVPHVEAPYRKGREVRGWLLKDC